MNTELPPLPKEGYEWHIMDCIDEIHLGDRLIVMRGNGYLLLHIAMNDIIPPQVKIPREHFFGQYGELWYRMHADGDVKKMNDGMLNLLKSVVGYRDKELARGCQPTSNYEVSIFAQGKLLDINRLVERPNSN